MKKPAAAELAFVDAASTKTDAKIQQVGDWRGEVQAKMRAIIHKADAEIVEEWKWAKATSPGVPVFSRGGIVCTGETYKSAVKLTFAKGASLPDPAGCSMRGLRGMCAELSIFMKVKR